MEARNLAPLPLDVEHEAAVAAAISGLTAWQAARAREAQGRSDRPDPRVAGTVGHLAAQLAREVGANVIGTGRTRDRGVVAGLHAFVDLAGDQLADVGQVDVVLDVLGDDVLDASAALVRTGGTLVTIAEPPRIRPADGRAIFFVVEPERAQLTQIAHRLRDGRLAPRIGAVQPLAEAAAAFGPAAPHGQGKTVIRVAETP